MSLPHAKHEDWRWADLAAIPAARAALAAANDGAIDPAPWRIGDGPLWLFVDGRLAARPDGPGTDYERDGHPLADAGTVARGLELAIGREHAAHRLVQIVHVATGGPSHLALRYALAEDAQASVVETFVQVGDTPAWANVGVEIDLARGARLMRHARRFEAVGTATETTTVTVGAAASYAGTTLLGGAASARAETRVTLAQAGAFAGVDGAVLAEGAAKHDIQTVITHAAPDTASRQTWRAVARGLATASIAGRVEIARDAQRSNAAQSIRGLLFDRTATINAKPELEIFADDVKASHGCTVGELDAAALFYMGARGLPPVRARALLTQAFLAQALEQAGDGEVREAFEADAFRWLEGAQ